MDICPICKKKCFLNTHVPKVHTLWEVREYLAKQEKVKEKKKEENIKKQKKEKAERSRVVMCPKCKAKLSKKNLKKHLRKVHKVSAQQENQKPPTKKQRLNARLYPDGIDEHEMRWKNIIPGGAPGLGKKR
jgi:hypothetical protein